MKLFYINFVNLFVIWSIAVIFSSCAAERQGIVCDEIEYRLNTMTYSPDQRAYQEEELKACREEESQKRGGSSKSQKSIYDRFALNDSLSEKNTMEDSKKESQEISVSNALQDSSYEKTTSIYERYGVMHKEEQDSLEASP